eukprot:4336985-Prymnesium_polylepis.1
MCMRYASSAASVGDVRDLRARCDAIARMVWRGVSAETSSSVSDVSDMQQPRLRGAAHGRFSNPRGERGGDCEGARFDGGDEGGVSGHRSASSASSRSFDFRCELALVARDTLCRMRSARLCASKSRCVSRSAGGRCIMSFWRCSSHRAKFGAFN